MEVNSSNYQKLAERTSATATQEGREASVDQVGWVIRLLHAGMGLCTEAGEFQDVLKKLIFYGKNLGPKEIANLAEEIGDVLWYCAEAANALGVTLDSVMERNIAKLAERYGDKFTEFKALNRDLEAEEKVLVAGWKDYEEVVYKAVYLLGCRITNGFLLVPEGDAATGWAARWVSVRFEDKPLHIPHWLPRWVSEKEVVDTRIVKKDEGKIMDLKSGQDISLDEYIAKVDAGEKPIPMSESIVDKVFGPKRESNYPPPEATSLAEVEKQLHEARLRDHQLADWARQYGQRLVNKCLKLEFANKQLALDIREAHQEALERGEAIERGEFSE